MSDLTPEPSSAGTSGQDRKRLVFRVLGVLLMGTALVLIGLAVADFFSAMASDSFDTQPTKFWMFFLALPFFAVGGLFLQLGFGGAGARFLAREYVPVLRESMDELNRPARSAATGPFCRSCGTQNDDQARFCDACGAPMGV